eukprot:6192935-Pleurochrysis_carterae.AAC.1
MRMVDLLLSFVAAACVAHGIDELHAHFDRLARRGVDDPRASPPGRCDAASLDDSHDASRRVRPAGKDGKAQRRRCERVGAEGEVQRVPPRRAEAHACDEGAGSRL